MKALILTVALLLTGCSAAVAPATVTTPVSTPGPLRQVHSPGAITADTTLTVKGCHSRTLSPAAGLILPDPGCTPGAIDPAVTQANIGATICKLGWTATVRPPQSNSWKYKKLALAAYGLSNTPSLEFDHLVPLELGGANSVSNLWPETNRTGAAKYLNPKDGVESSLRAAVCSGRIPLAAAQTAIASNWTTAKKALGL